MFSYIKLKNYRSLIDFDVNLVGKLEMPKKFVLIYGKSGIGKSDFVRSFFTLQETLHTMSSDRDIASIIEQNRTLGSVGPMLLEFGFTLNGRKGFYRLEMDDAQIISERLDYAFSKNRTVFYEISKERTRFNGQLFQKPVYRHEFMDLFEKFWGRHSLLSLFLYAIEEKKPDRWDVMFSPAMCNLLSHFSSLPIRTEDSCHIEKGKLRMGHKIWDSPGSGMISLEESGELDRAETFFNEFFTHLHCDIHKVYYQRETVGEEIAYHLMFKKISCGQFLEIPFEKESGGIHQLMKIIPFFLACTRGETVIIDNIDDGIHDILINAILKNLYVEINGQLILTTRSTFLLESGLRKEFIYLFQSGWDLKKELISLHAYEQAPLPNTGKWGRQPVHVYGGISLSTNISFHTLINIL